MILNNKGISLVEALVATLLTAVAVISLMTMLPLAWQSAGKADSMTRATELMQRQLETVELEIMRGNIPSNTTNSVTVGNESFTVATTVSAGTIASSRLVNVHVTWYKSSTGVKSSLLVTRQSGF